MKTPLRPRYARIERMVDQLLDTHRVKQAPVPIEKIVMSQGVQIRRTDLGDVSGMLIRESNTVLIGLNSKQSKTRQRFTLSHEFGHYLLHEGKALHYDRTFRVNLRSDLSSQAIDVEEMEANFFAACVLVPRTFLERDMADLLIDLDDDESVRGLARQYDVSAQAMSIRVLNLFGQ